MVVSRARRVCAGIVIVCGVVAVGASAQEWTAQPAPTQARVWVQNRGQSEAVPVMVVPSAAPLPVQVGGTVLVATPPGGQVQTRASRQVWEYRGVHVAAGQDPVAALVAAGQDGWETTGLVFPGAGHTVVVMKRPR